jgi:hypothetical protein
VTGDSNGWWQATKCPSPSGSITGSVVTHTSVAAGQRGWNRHPVGGFTGDGGSPVIAVPMTGTDGSGTGIESSKTFV